MKMKKYSSPKGLINFLHVIFQIGFFLLSLILVLWLLIGIISFLTDGTAHQNAYPVMFSLTDDGIFNSSVNAINSNFQMEHATGIISTESLPKGFFAIYSLIVLIANICMLLSMGQIIRILESVKKDCFLIIENAVRLRWIALLAIAIFFFDRLAVIYSASYFSSKLEFQGLEFTNINLFSFVHLDSIFSALFLLVIAEAFRIGAQLKEENDLTI